MEVGVDSGAGGRGPAKGMFSFVAFYWMLSATLAPLGLVSAFALAIVTARLTQGGSLILLRRVGSPAG